MDRGGPISELLRLEGQQSIKVSPLPPPPRPHSSQDRKFCGLTLLVSQQNVAASDVWNCPPLNA